MVHETTACVWLRMKNWFHVIRLNMVMFHTSFCTPPLQWNTPSECWRNPCRDLTPPWNTPSLKEFFPPSLPTSHRLKKIKDVVPQPSLSTQSLFHGDHRLVWLFSSINQILIHLARAQMGEKNGGYHFPSTLLWASLCAQHFRNSSWTSGKDVHLPHRNDSLSHKKTFLLLSWVHIGSCTRGR